MEHAEHLIVSTPHDHTQCKEITHAGVSIHGQMHRCRPSRSVLAVVTVLTTVAHTYLVTHHSSKSSIASAVNLAYSQVYQTQHPPCPARRLRIARTAGAAGRRSVWSCCPHTQVGAVGSHRRRYNCSKKGDGIPPQY